MLRPVGARHRTEPVLNFDDMVGEALRATLRYRCPKCRHLSGYMTTEGVKCWWPECRYQAPSVKDLGGFVDTLS